MDNKLTPKDGKQALLHHVVDKAIALREKYVNFIDFAALDKILEDRDFVRYPTCLEFSSKPIGDGFFAVTEPVSDADPSQGYIITIDGHFKDQLGDVPALALYQLVIVNYGDIATSEEAELFGATVLGMGKEEYYQLLCTLADQIPQ